MNRYKAAQVAMFRVNKNCGRGSLIETSFFGSLLASKRMEFGEQKYDKYFLFRIFFQ